MSQTTAVDPVEARPVRPTEEILDTGNDQADRNNCEDQLDACLRWRAARPFGHAQETARAEHALKVHADRNFPKFIGLAREILEIDISGINEEQLVEIIPHLA